MMIQDQGHAAGGDEVPAPAASRRGSGHSGVPAHGPRAARGTTRLVDIPTPPASTLRVALVDDGDAGEVLILCHGFGTGDDFRRPDWCGTPIRLPANSLPDLLAALKALRDG